MYNGYNPWCNMNGMNPSLYNYTYGGTCFPSYSSSYSDGQLAGSIFGMIGAGVAIGLVGRHKNVKAAKQQEAANTNNAVTNALKEMPAPYNTESTYNTPVDQMAKLEEKTKLDTANGEVESATSKFQKAEAKVKEADEKLTTATTNYNNAESAYNNAKTAWENAVNKSKDVNNDNDVNKCKTIMEQREKDLKAAEDAKKAAEGEKKEAEKAKNEAQEAKDTAEKAKTTAQSNYDAKKTEIEGKQIAVADAIKKRDDLNAGKETEADNKALNKADGNWLTRKLDGKDGLQQKTRNFRKQLQVCQAKGVIGNKSDSDYQKLEECAREFYSTYNAESSHSKTDGEAYNIVNKYFPEETLKA